MVKVTRLLPTRVIESEPKAGNPAFAVGPAESGGSPAQARIPHRHEFTELLYVTEGRGSHVIDLMTIPIRPPQLFYIPQGQVHYIDAASPVHGTLVVFRDEFFRDLDVPLGRLLDGVGPVTRPDATQARRLELLFGELSDEFARTDMLQDMVLQSLVTVLLAQCRRISAETAVAQPAGLCMDFMRMVTSGPVESLKVADCADRLGVTAGYLYEVVVERYGRTPSEIIRSAVLTEAERLLARTDASCAQIAVHLGFSDASYFSRFFRREAGVTPSAFRDEHRVVAFTGDRGEGFA